MSCKVRSLTPFTHKVVLKRTLNKMEIAFREKGANLILERKDYIGNKSFNWIGNQYEFTHDSDGYNNEWEGTKWKNDNAFMKDVEKNYRQIALSMGIKVSKEKLDATKREIMDRAKKQGYRVKEKKVGEKIKLVLTRGGKN